MPHLPDWLLVGLGGFCGSTLRYGAAVLLRRCDLHAAWSAVAVNVTGSLLIGLLFGRLAGAPGLWWSFLAVGLCGGFTTFSALSLDTLGFVHRGQWLEAGGNVVLQVVLGLAAVWIGYTAAQGLR